MSTPLYRLTVVACALTWFLVGLHAPVIHDVTEHGRAPRTSLLMILALLVLIGGASVVALLRMPRAHPDSPPTRPATP